MRPARDTGPLPEVGRHRASETERLMANVWPILQTSVAASLAYFLAAVVLGNEQPFFAPVAAVVTLGLALAALEAVAPRRSADSSGYSAGSSRV